MFIVAEYSLSSLIAVILPSLIFSKFSASMFNKFAMKEIVLVDSMFVYSSHCIIGNAFFLSNVWSNISKVAISLSVAFLGSFEMIETSFSSLN